MKTKHLCTLGLAAILMALGIFGPALAASITAGLPSLSYSQSGVWDGNSAEAAFNGGAWNAGDHGNQWVQVDTLTSHVFTSVSFLTGQEPDGETSQSIYISDSPIGDDFNLLTPVATRSGFTIDLTPVLMTFAPTSGRYLQIVANGGPSWTSLLQISAVPIPSAGFLLAPALVGLGFFRRRDA